MTDAWGHNTWALRETPDGQWQIWNQDGDLGEPMPTSRAAREWIDEQIDTFPGDRWHPFFTMLGKSAGHLARRSPEEREQYRREWTRYKPVGPTPAIYPHPDEVDRLVAEGAERHPPAEITVRIPLALIHRIRAELGSKSHDIATDILLHEIVEAAA